jgi:MraZ protein
VEETGDNPPLLGITSENPPNEPSYKTPISMLLGEFQHNLDPKGRMAIPAKFRDKLTAGAIITRGIDNCLFVFANDEWEVLAAKLIALPLAQANSRAFTRLMLAGASDVEVDAQGRILIPDYLRKYAGLKKEVIVTGLYTRIEIWDEESWKTYKAKTESSSEAIAEQLGELGI